MALTIRERLGTTWRTTTLEPRTVTESLWSTMVNGRNGQEIDDGWIEAGTTVYVRPGDLQKDSRPPFWEPGDPSPKWTIYDAHGMAHKVDFFEARDALEAL